MSGRPASASPRLFGHNERKKALAIKREILEIAAIEWSRASCAHRADEPEKLLELMAAANDLRRAKGTIG